MRPIKPENRIKRRIKELKKIFSLVDEDKQKLVMPMIEMVANMEQQLGDLLVELKETGFVEQYQNGENQFGTKESTVSKAYSNVFKNYTNAIRTLLSCLPDSAPPEVEDSLMEFVRSHKKQ
jgi:isopenicillin N synthase-like dioxygenase